MRSLFVLCFFILGSMVVAFTDNKVRDAFLTLTAFDSLSEKKTLLKEDSSERMQFEKEDLPLVVGDLALTRVPYTEKLTEDLCHAPCPTSSWLEERIWKAIKPIGFDGASTLGTSSLRSFEDIMKEKTKETDLNTLFDDLRDVILAYYKFSHPHSGLVFGLSGAGDLIAAARVCICDHIALMHHHVEGGIDDIIDVVDPKTSKKTPTPEQKEALHRIYRSCKMTTLNSHRFENAWHTRVAYHPNQDDEDRINRLLRIDPLQPEVVVCTYKKSVDAIDEKSDAQQKEIKEP